MAVWDGDVLTALDVRQTKKPQQKKSRQNPVRLLGGRDGVFDLTSKLFFDFPQPFIFPEQKTRFVTPFFTKEILPVANNAL